MFVSNTVIVAIADEPGRKIAPQLVCPRTRIALIPRTAGETALSSGIRLPSSRVGNKIDFLLPVNPQLSPAAWTLQGAQVIQQILLLLTVQLLKQIDHGICLRTGTGMILNRREQTTIGGRSAAVVQKEKALPQTPQRSGPELIRAGRTLRNVICQSRAHMVYQQI